MSPVSLKLSELCQFLYRKIRQNLVISKFLNLHILSYWIFEILTRIFYVFIIYTGFEMSSCNMGSHSVPSLVSRGWILSTSPPHAYQRKWYPMKKELSHAGSSGHRYHLDKSWASYGPSLHGLHPLWGSILFAEDSFIRCNNSCLKYNIFV